VPRKVGSGAGLEKALTTDDILVFVNHPGPSNLGSLVLFKSKWAQASILCPACQFTSKMSLASSALSTTVPRSNRTWAYMESPVLRRFDFDWFCRFVLGDGAPRATGLLSFSSWSCGGVSARSYVVRSCLALAETFDATLQDLFLNTLTGDSGVGGRNNFFCLRLDWSFLLYFSGEVGICFDCRVTVSFGCPDRWQVSQKWPFRFGENHIKFMWRCACGVFRGSQTYNKHGVLQEMWLWRT
jgi:hypothetical protein